jgi:predicted Zn finger-like uncharacterized protein
MIIDCPQCTAQFRVEDAAIPATGRRVRCTACAHVWHYVVPGTEPPPPADFQTAMMQAGAPLQAPRVQGPKPFVIKRTVPRGPFFRTDRPGLMGYTAAILVALAIISVVHGHLVGMFPSLAAIDVLMGTT